MKKVFSFVLCIIMLSMLCSCTNEIETTSPTSNKEDDIIWVLVEEKEQYSNEFSEQSIIYEKHYGYDGSGRLTECNEDYGTNDFNSYDFKYDTNGNVISKTVERSDKLASTTSLSYWTYTYDEKGNLTTQNVDWTTDNAIDYTEFEYDEQGNVIKEQNKYTSETFTQTSSKTKELTYENGKVIQSEATIELNTDGIKEYNYTCEKYTYDENGNMQTKLYYVDIEDDNDAKNPVLINGRYYKLYSTTYYTYSKLQIAQNGVSNTANNDTITTTTTTTTTTATEPPTLSDECDMILATGYDGDNYYELVANQIDEYPDSTFKFGVIKNNKWLVQMSANCPFIDENGWWKGLDRAYQSNTVSEEDFKHVSGPLFLYKNSIVYNPESGVSFENLSNINYDEIENYNEFVGFESYHEEGTANHYVYFKYFNTQTGESKKIEGYFDNVQRPDVLKDISNDLFYAEGKTRTWDNFQYTKYSGFFDLKGNMVLDLSEYSITDYHDYKYKNGKYTITCTNNSNVKYDITFDTSGKIINSEKSS